MGFQENIVLVGLMGSGKSSVGRALCKKAGWKRIDTDRWIEETTGCTISEIFNLKGEEEFRRWECMAVNEVCRATRTIISTGGGTIENERNRQKLWSVGTVFYLQASVPVLFKRVQKKTTRPLLQKADPVEVLENLLERRRHFYQQAHYTIDVDHLKINEIANEIWKLYTRNSGRSSSSVGV